MAAYQTKRSLVEAVQLEDTVNITTITGEVVEGNKGDWLVTIKGHGHVVFTNEEFTAQYEPAPSNPLWKWDSPGYSLEPLTRTSTSPTWTWTYPAKL